MSLNGSKLIGQKLKDARIKIGLTPSQVADCLKIDESNLISWEEGDQYISLSAIDMLANLYNCELEFLVICQKVESKIDFELNLTGLDTEDLQIITWCNRFLSNLEFLNRLKGNQA